MQARDEQVNEPKHYQFGAFQAIDVIEGVSRGICDPVAAVMTSHALKYLMRWPRKNGLRDLKKARWYLDRLISYLDAVQIPPAPDYDPASVAFRHGDAEYFALNYGFVPGIGDVPRVTAAELAERDGAGEYGNPVTPSCVTSCPKPGVNAHDMTHETPWKLP